MTLADKIMKLRRDSGMSQEELAEKLNVSRQAVSKWECGETVPDLQKIIHISELFSVTTDYLLKDDVMSKCESALHNDADMTAEENCEQRRCALSWWEISSAYWVMMAAVYLLVSFLTGAWYLTWIIWVASPAIETLIKGIYRSQKNRK